MPQSFPNLTRRVLASRRISSLTSDEHARLEAAISEVRSVPARSILTRKMEILEHSTLLLSGILSRYVDDRRGNRQFVSMNVPGDLVDLHGFPLKMLDHDVAAISEAKIAILPHTALRTLIEDLPELARKLWSATLLDAAMHREWIFRLGRLDATGRVCHFFAETGERLRAVGLGTLERYSLPILHADVGEVCGLTNVHVSRVLKILRETGVCTFRDGEFRSQDLATLRKLGEFDPAYLYIDETATPPGNAEGD